MNWKCRFGLHPWEKWKEVKVKVWVDLRPTVSMPADPYLALLHSNRTFEYNGPTGMYQTKLQQLRICHACGRTQRRGVYV